MTRTRIVPIPTNRPGRCSIIFLISIMIMAGLLISSTVLAGHPGRRMVTDRHARHGRVFAKRHAGHHRIHARGADHFYRRGSFYRKRMHYSKRPKGFVYLTVPISAIITAPPANYRTVVVRNTPYYVSSGVYYRKAPTRFTVVEAPSEVVVAADSLPGAKPSAVVSEKVMVTASGLNIRSGPGLHHSVIDQVQRGDTLLVRGNAPGWLYVELSSGQYGWVMDSFTVPHTPPADG